MQYYHAKQVDPFISTSPSWKNPPMEREKRGEKKRREQYESRKAEILAKRKEKWKQKNDLREQQLNSSPATRNQRLKWKEAKARHRQQEQEALEEETKRKAQLEATRAQQRKRKAKQRAKMKGGNVCWQRYTNWRISKQKFKNASSEESKGSLPKMLSKRTALLKLIVESPSIREALQEAGVSLNSAEEDAEARFTVSAKEALQKVKRNRSNDSWAAAQVGLSMLVGDNVTRGRIKKRIARSLNLNRNRVGQAPALRKKIPTSAKSCWTCTKLKTRSDAIPTDNWKFAHDFWSSPEISRTKPDNKNFVRKRLAAKTWVSHKRQILEKKNKQKSI